MRTVKTVIGFTLVACLLSSIQARGQAHVDESQESAILYVDATNGSDSNPGTQLKPLKTIAQAANLAQENNRAGIGTRVIVNPGTYREAVSLLGGAKDTAFPITFQAATPGKAILSGADVWTDWTVEGREHLKYSHPWPFQWGLCPADGGEAPAEPDIVRRREMIFINGVAMTQVETASAMRLGTFYVDEAQGLVHVKPPLGTDMNNAKVEVSTRDILFNMARKANVVFRGLTFQYASSCRGDAALFIQNSDNLLLDNNYFFWNNAAGLMARSVSDLTVQGSVANHNGTSGLKSRRTKNALWQNDTAYYNGWRGAQGVYYKWSESGFHFMLAHNQSVHNLNSSWNETHAFHWDTDSINVAADTLTASQNLLSGTVIERVQGPLSISNAVYCNGNPLMGPNTIGFHLRNSMNVTVSGSQIRGNRSGVNVSGDVGGRVIQNFETGADVHVINSNFNFNNNVIYSDSTQKTFNDGQLGGQDWDVFQSTLASDYNTWWNPDNTKTFAVPVPVNYTNLDLASWQALAGTDAHSVWKTPGQPGARCVFSPDISDFWFVMDFQGGVQAVTAGSNATFTAYIIPLQFTGVVYLRQDGVELVPGATATWSQSHISDSGSADFTVTTSKSTPAGTYPITLIARSGNVTRTMSVWVIVQ